MIVYKGFRYRIYPNAQQVARIEAWESALRFLWNLSNEQRLISLARPRDERVFVSAFDQMKQLTELRANVPWLEDVPRNVCGQLLKELDKAWGRCFEKISRAPQWKRKGRDFLGITEPHPKVWRIDGSLLRFPKLGSIRAVVHRPLQGKPKMCTLRREGDQWFASILCEIEVTEPVPRSEPVVAIDRGVINAVADSDGRIVESPQHFRDALHRLARAQRKLSRKKKGSSNYRKASLRVARIYRKVTRQRAHFIHQLSAGYSKSHGRVVVESLQIGNMVKANTGLARGILDAGWGILVEQLKYKLRLEGGALVDVNAAYSSQTCSACGSVDPNNRLSQSEFVCSSCGYVDHADLNAAKNLLARSNRSGLPGEASGLPSRRPRKQSHAVRRRPEVHGS